MNLIVAWLTDSNGSLDFSSIEFFLVSFVLMPSARDEVVAACLAHCAFAYCTFHASVHIRLRQASWKVRLEIGASPHGLFHEFLTNSFN